ncbi:MAG TPA: thioredoxin domain-containing protein, partial [Chthonomonadales bacterium]|nr:thioredoxin domain-containing protein [Chthonomonadales bacterium]
NPVDWWPWCSEAFVEARRRDVPVLLSVGYSACHWCHVMERESFESAPIAKLMNESFVCIKVDREERPDIDSVYMNAVQVLTGQGGWPMTVFLTPEGAPFYGGTYFPPRDYPGRIGFPRLLEAIGSAWRDRRHEFVKQAERLVAVIEIGQEPATASQVDPSKTISDQAFRRLCEEFDEACGGFGQAPKFPQPGVLEFLLHFGTRTGAARALEMVTMTLQRMAVGGIYDHLGGGFHRYATDDNWRVPHFEKMLYDNAQLALLYVHAYQSCRNPRFKALAIECLDYLFREMRDPQGGFYCAQDADSQGVEGQYFVWTMPELQEILGQERAALFAERYGVAPRGNWEGANILYEARSLADLSAAHGLAEAALEAELASCKEKLKAVRDRRVPPQTDDKALAGWNGLAISALAQAGRSLEEPRFVEAALQCAKFLQEQMTWRDDGGHLRLRRSWRNGKASGSGYLEDYALLAAALIDLYAATFDETWLTCSRELIETTIACFWDEQGDGFFTTARDQEPLIQRPKDWTDNAVPGGNSVALRTLLKLSVYFDDGGYRDRAARMLRRVGERMPVYPQAFAGSLRALMLFLDTPLEVALIGLPPLPDSAALLRTITSSYMPDLILAGAAADNGSKLPLLRGKSAIAGKAAAYLCANYACMQPVTAPENLQELLSARAASRS